MGFANKIAPSVSLNTNLSIKSSQVFEKKAVENPKNLVFGHF